MKNREGHNEDTIFFVGREVEKTPMIGQRTLFVVGKPMPVVVIDEAKKYGVSHVYLGANQSFDAEELHHWSQLGTSLLKAGYWVTLDYTVLFHEDVLEMGLNEYDKFISMISVPLPAVDLLNYNAIIKIDDKGFNATNPGVWCHYMHDLKNRDNFTSWDNYEDDEVIK